MTVLKDSIYLFIETKIFSGHSSLVLDIRRYILCSFLFRGVLDRPKTRISKYPVHQWAKKETSLYISGCVSTHALSIQRPCISISRKANFQMFFAKCFGNKNVTCCPTPVLLLWCLRRKCDRSTFISISITPWLPPGLQMAQDASRIVDLV